MAGTARSDLRDYVRERARLGSNISDATIDNYLNRAALQFQRGSLLIVDFFNLTVRSYFTLRTNEAFSLTIASILTATDIVVASNIIDGSGADVATALQTAIQAAGAAATTVSFDEDTGKFTIDASGETGAGAITISYPSSRDYYDSSYKLFGKTTSSTDNVFVSSMAPYYTSEYPLPDDFLEIEEVVYNERWWEPLKPEIYRKRAYLTGIPKHYSIYNKRNPSETGISGNYIRFTLQPLTIGVRFYIAYNPEAKTIQTGTAYDTHTFDFPTGWDDALIFYAAYLAKLANNDYQEALTFKALYEDIKDEAINSRSIRVGSAFDMMERGRKGL